MPFVQQEFSGRPRVNEIPGEQLILCTLTSGIEVQIDSCFLHCLRPAFPIPVLRPRIKQRTLSVSGFNRTGHPAVSPGKQSFENRDISLMPVIADGLMIQACLDLLIDRMRKGKIILWSKHGCPLEWGKWLRYKERSGNGDHAFSVPLLLWNRIVIEFRDLLRKLRNRPAVLLRLGRLAQHKVQLHLIPASAKCICCTAQNVFFPQPLIDHIPHPLGTAFRRKGQRAFLHILHLAHDIQRKCINAQGRQGYIDILCLSVFFDQIIDQSLQLGIVTCGKRAQRDLFLSCLSQKLVSVALQRVQTLGSGRAVDHAGLTEPASADTATLHLKHNSVLRNLHKRHQRFFEKWALVQIFHNLFLNTSRHALFCRCERRKGTVIPVGRLIEQRTVDPGDLRSLPKELKPGCALVLACLIKIEKRVINCLALSDIKQIKELCDRLRIIGTGTSADYDGSTLTNLQSFDGPVQNRLTR